MGVAHRVGLDMCYWLMPVSSTPVVNSSVQHVTSEDLQNPDMKVRINKFNEKLHTQMDDTNFTLPGKDIDFYYPHDVYDIPPQNSAENRDALNGDARGRQSTGSR
jgi:hypothetical protein